MDTRTSGSETCAARVRIRVRFRRTGHAALAGRRRRTDRDANDLPDFDPLQSCVDGPPAVSSANDGVSWILEGARGTERVLEVEAMMNQVYPTSRAVGLWPYDRRPLDPATLESALHTHAVVGASGRLFNNRGFDPANRMRAVSLDAANAAAARDSVRRHAVSAAARARVGRGRV